MSRQTRAEDLNSEERRGSSDAGTEYLQSELQLGRAARSRRGTRTTACACADVGLSAAVHSRGANLFCFHGPRRYTYCKTVHARVTINSCVYCEMKYRRNPARSLSALAPCSHLVASFAVDRCTMGRCARSLSARGLSHSSTAHPAHVSQAAARHTSRPHTARAQRSQHTEHANVCSKAPCGPNSRRKRRRSASPHARRPRSRHAKAPSE